MAPLIIETKPIPLREVLDILEVSIHQLTESTQLNHSVVRRAVMGGTIKTHISSAQLIAKALGMETYEIEWPCGLTDKGREALSGGSYTKHVKNSVSFCSNCTLQLPSSNICSCA
jgi:hypothetical protein